MDIIIQNHLLMYKAIHASCALGFNNPDAFPIIGWKRSAVILCKCSMFFEFCSKLGIILLFAVWLKMLWFCLVSYGGWVEPIHDGGVRKEMIIILAAAAAAATRTTMRLKQCIYGRVHH